jgi:hypothetical protein
MNVVPPHEISQINYLNSNAYIVIECDIWQKDCILILYVCFLSKFPKMALNFLKNALKLLNKGDLCSNKGVNQTKLMLHNKVLMRPTWVGVIGYWWTWN